MYALNTEPELLARWWGPNGFSVPSVELDTRVGGRYRIEMQPPRGDSFSLSGRVPHGRAWNSLGIHLPSTELLQFSPTDKLDETERAMADWMSRQQGSAS